MFMNSDVSIDYHENLLNSGYLKIKFKYLIAVTFLVYLTELILCNSYLKKKTLRTIGNYLESKNFQRLSWERSRTRYEARNRF